MDCGGYTTCLLSSCEYFTVHTITLKSEANLHADEKSFHSLMCLDGEAELTSENGNITLKKGDSVFLPANFGAYKLSGSGEYILTTV